MQLSPIANIAIQLPLLVAATTTLLLLGPRGLRWLRVVLLGLGWLLVDVIVHPLAVTETGALAGVPVVPAVAVATLLVAFGAARREVRTAVDCRRSALIATIAVSALFLLVPQAAGLAVALLLWVGGTLGLAIEFRRNAQAHPGSLLDARLRVLAAALVLLASVAFSTFGGPGVVVWVLPMVLGTATLVLAVAPPPFLQLVVAPTRDALRRADRDLVSFGTHSEAGLRSALEGVRRVLGAEAALLVDQGAVVADVAVGDAEGARSVGLAWLAEAEGDVATASELQDVSRLRPGATGHWLIVAPTGRGLLVLVLRPVGVLLSRTDREQVGAFADRIGLGLDRADAERRDRQATASLQAAERMRDDLLSTLSHELRTPLTSIMGFSEVLRDHSPMLTDEQQRDMLGRILAKGGHLERLVSSLLDLTAIRGRSEPERLARYDLDQLVERAVVRARDRLGLRSVHLVGEGGIVHTDGGAVLAILEQLLDNAAKFSDDGSSVEVTVHGTPDRITVRVRDHGVGLQDIDRGAMFEPFVRGGDVLTRDTGGVGVGLTIARELTHQLGGDLCATEVEGGAAFELWIPRRHELARHDDGEAPTASVEAAESDPTLQPYRAPSPSAVG